MLPKEDKIKRNSDEKQPGLFDKEEERKKVIKRRKFVVIFLIIFTGFPFLLLTYRSVKNIDLSVAFLSFNFNTPKINKTISLKDPTKDTWSIYLKNSKNEAPDYQKNQELLFTDQNLDSILALIDKSDYVSSSQYTQLLPEGLKIKESIEEKNGSFFYLSKITTPSEDLLLLVKISDIKDLSIVKTNLPSFIDQLYWYSLQK